ncbi:MAG: hypothetical protein ACREPV_12060 [Lysobacter sp.]
MLTAAERSILRRKLERYESRIPHMYCDSKGHVTVGVGHLLASVSDAKLCAFVDHSGRRATADQIAEDYDSVKKAPEGNNAAGFYRAYTKLVLPNHEIDRLTERHIASFHRELRVIYGEFDRFPSPVRLALFDLIFNVGATDLRTKWPSMNKAIRVQDWEEAGRESNRPEVGLDRNTYVRELFNAAAAMEVAQ